jgi:hypothetical protein
MPPPPWFLPSRIRALGGFTLAGAITSLALIAAAAAVCVPLVARRLRLRTPAAEEAARRVDSAVSRGLESVGALADAFASAAAAIRPSVGGPVAASLPDGPIGVPIYPADPWEGPPTPPPGWAHWGLRPFFWKPIFPRPAPWYFYRHPPWKAGGRLRK